MPKAKQPKSTQEFDAGRETRVLLGQIRSEVRTVSEQHGSVMEKLQEHDQRFEKIERKLDQHDAHFLHIDQRFKNMDVRFDRLEKVVTGVMSGHETRIKRLEAKAAF
jgi:uncharacterized coiled-coil DUF342 family protein